MILLCYVIELLINNISNQLMNARNLVSQFRAKHRVA